MIRSAGILINGALCALAVLATAAFPASAQTGRNAGESPDRPGFQWTDHPTLILGPVAQVEVRARVQLDTHPTVTDADDERAGGLDLAKRRLGVAGVLLKIVEFEVDRELKDDDDPWRDVYVNLRLARPIQVQAGKFKLPFSLDENTSATNLNFIHRSMLGSYLSPGRDRGVMVHGRVLDGLRYEVGIFDHDGGHARTANPARVYGGRTPVARVRLSPFRSGARWRRTLQGGVAFTTSQVPEGVPGIRGRTVLDASFFSSRYWVQGTRRRYGTELRWQPGPFSIESEYIRVVTERRGVSVENTDLSSLVAEGWYVSGTWAVTGERKARGLERPRRPVSRGGLGAIEVAVRAESLGFSSAATGEAASSSPRAEVIVGNRDRAQTYGVNWHPHRWVKVQVNAVREALSNPALGPRPGHPVFWSRQLRLQLTL